MADAKHTPGPWQLDPPSLRHVNDHEYHSIVAGDGVADGRWKGFTASAFMAIEDARLIAAAPELLEALIALEAAASWQETEDISAYDNAVHAARAAIAKATGSAK